MTLWRTCSQASPGIDAALLVVAVDEGVMPQTTEHLAILDLLQIPAGVIALTKTDLVAGRRARWTRLKAERAPGSERHRPGRGRRSYRCPHGLAAAWPICWPRLSAVLRLQPERPDLGRPRLPIDRVFSMSGFGTIVTGTLERRRNSQWATSVEVLPSGLRGRVRGLQTHRKAIDRAVPGSRTAVNIAGIPAERLRRGQVLSRPGCYEATLRVDARLRVLADASRSLVHNSEVKVFLGTTEAVASLRLLDKDRTCSPASRVGSSSSCAIRWCASEAMPSFCAGRRQPRPSEAAASSSPRPLVGTSDLTSNFWLHWIRLPPAILLT